MTQHDIRRVVEGAMHVGKLPWETDATRRDARGTRTKHDTGSLVGDRWQRYKPTQCRRVVRLTMSQWCSNKDKVLTSTKNGANRNGINHATKSKCRSIKCQ